MEEVKCKTVKPKTWPRKHIIRAWAIFAAVLIITLLLELPVHLHANFDVDALLFFNAWYGFAACAAMVILAKFLGFALKRRESYYAHKGGGHGHTH